MDPSLFQELQVPLTDAPFPRATLYCPRPLTQGTESQVQGLLHDGVGEEQ